MRPVIGIVGKIGKSGRDYTLIDNALRQALIDSGALPIGILSPQPYPRLTELYKERELKIKPRESEILTEQLKLCRGIVLQGGQRIAEYEYLLAKMAYEQDIPTLGICRGQTIMARVLGAQITDVDAAAHDQTGDYVHEIEVVSGTHFHEIVKCDRMRVNSRHRRAVVPSESFRTAAISPDGYAEVIEVPEKKFYMGMRFYPENLYRDDLVVHRIFQAFVQSTLAT